MIIKMVVIILVVLIVALYYLYGSDFVEGAVEYATNNNNNLFNPEDPWKSVCDESAELIEAICAMSPYNVFLEFFDVVLASIKYLVITFLPTQFIFSWVCWALIFPFVFPVAIKLGTRYRLYGCIRNHTRFNLDHRCSINGNL